MISLGGEYLPGHDAFGGVTCEATIASLRADVLFMSASAVSGCNALHQEQETVRIKRAMLACAGKRVLLVDHGKLGKAALHQVAPLSVFDLVIVDEGASRDEIENLEDCAARVEVAPL